VRVSKFNIDQTVTQIKHNGKPWIDIIKTQSRVYIDDTLHVNF